VSPKEFPRVRMSKIIIESAEEAHLSNHLGK
jgi:hypothetical protein